MTNQASLTSILTSKTQTDVTAHNLANMDNSNAEKISVAKKSIQRSFGGVQITAFTRNAQPLLEKQLNSEISLSSTYSIVRDYYEKAQNLLGTPSEKRGLNYIINNFFAAMQGSGNEVFRKELLDKVNASAVGISGLAEALQQIRLDAEKEISQSVHEVNEELANANDINNRLLLLSKGTQEYVQAEIDLKNSLQKLSEYVDVRKFHDSKGRLHLQMGTNSIALGQPTQELKYESLISTEQLVKNTPFSALTLGGTPIVSGGTSQSVTHNFKSGKIPGLLKVRDKIIPEILQKLDVFAKGFKDKVNEVHNKGSSVAKSLTGTKTFSLNTPISATNTVRIASLDSQGNNIKNGANVVQALNIDLTTTTSIQQLKNTIDSYTNNGVSPFELQIVDKDGNEIIDANQQGFLKISGLNSNYIAIDSLESNVSGLSGNTGQQSNKGFSDFFGLNDLFINANGSNAEENAAFYMDVRADIKENTAMLASSSLHETDNGGTKSYSVGIGDISTLIKISQVSGEFENESIKITNFVASQTKSAIEKSKDQDSKKQAIKEKLQNLQGINQDVELANILKFQQMYNSSAHAMKVSREMVDRLIASF